MNFMRHLKNIECDCEYLHCLIAYHAAPTLLGIKPATLFRPQPNGRDLNSALKECAHCLARDLGVEVAGFRNRAGALLLLVYRPELLAKTLAEKEVTDLLAETGYDVGRDDWRALLETLGQKCAEAAFPHEIGVFLGYPASDVRLFMQGCQGGCRCGAKDEKAGRCSECPAAGATAWKAYGDIEAAERRTENYRAAQVRAAELVVAGVRFPEIVSGLARVS